MSSRHIAAWTVHLVTAGGAVLSLLALAAVARDAWQAALVWMTLAMAVDSFDGFIARAAAVKEVLPGFDGELLDNMVDYLGYVVVPAFIVLRADLVPAALALPLAGAILLASAYQFCQTDAKTADHCFKGFPSFWNVAVFYLFFLGMNPRVNLAVLALLVAGVFLPVKWAYPSRMLRLRGVTMALSVLWGGSIVAILMRYPDPGPWLLGLSLVYLGYYAAVSLYLSGPLPARSITGRARSGSR